jgi:hypothetical protein
MRYLMIGAALAAVSGAGLAQESGWGYYEPEGGTMQAGVQGSNGTQLILKCDEPGKRKVYAVVVAPTQLAPAKGASQFENRPVTLAFDGGAPVKDTWRFNDKFAAAMDDVNLRTMSRFAEKLGGASKLTVSLEPFRQSPVHTSFDVAGAADAIARVYESCQDENPLG